MKKFTQFSVNYPVTVMMMVLAVLLLGYISFERLGIDLFPDLNNPKLFIELTAGEKPPEEIEKNFTDNLEALSIRQQGVVNVSSVSMVGSAQITVEYDWDKDMDEAFLDLQKTLSSATQNWDIEELTISQYDPNAEPIMIVAFSHPQIKDMNSLRKTAENYIRNELIRLEGIADVEISGAEEKEVSIQTSSYMLEAHGLTLEALQQRIDQFNRNVSGGSIVEMGKRYIIKGVSIYQDINDFENTIVRYERVAGMDTVGFAPVYLKDVAAIEFTNKEPENIVSINGERCLGLSIYKETKFNTVQAIDNLESAISVLNKALPGYEFTVVHNQGEFIKFSISEVEQTAIYGIILAVIILFVFLRRIGVTAIISAAIPISIIATFNLMYFNGLSLNIMTLGGLALGAGMLVDNAIVVMENIFRHIESGSSIKDAAVNGTAEVGGAITASTITTIIVFLPIVYLHGTSGELFKDQAWTVAFSLVSSLFVAILVIPMLSSKFLKNTHGKKTQSSISFPKYRGYLSSFIDKRWIIITGAALLVAISILLIPFVGSEFMPKTNSGEITLEVKLAEGTELERTAETVQSLELSIKDVLGEEVETIFSQIGPSSSFSSDESSFFEDENTASIKIHMKNEREISNNKIIASLQKAFDDLPEIEIRFMYGSTPLNQIIGTEDAPIVVEVKGDDLEIIEQYTELVYSKMQNVSELFNIESSFEKGAPEIEVEIDRLRAGLFNISVDQISSQLQDKLTGKDGGDWDYEGELSSITLKLPDITLKELEAITIQSANGEYRLIELADIKLSETPKEINRKNQNRIGTVTAQIADDIPLDHLVSKLKDELNQIDFPPNYSAQITGEELKREESMSSLTFALLLSIILVYMALASQFESLIHPFTILLTIPLAGVGAVFIFAILGIPFNIMAFIGIIMLAGIAVNDSIILVDAINQLKRDGLERKDAILGAGERRIRPIFMTSLTTILALLPLTFGFGEGAELRSPMALAVIGGLVTSTILTLVVIPCVYYVLDVFKEKIKINI
ncbi:MAG: efflux RND transporter permease subunit [Melioribacteraceae bacterium]|nr:efflux RND transporter permease subunit [Melioribacteraceae bacterium]